MMVHLLTKAMPALMTIGGIAMMAIGAGFVPGLALATTGVMGVAQQVGDMTYDPKGGPVVQTSPIEGGLGQTFQGTKNDKVVMSPTAGESAGSDNGPIVINLKIGNETIQQVVHKTDFSKAYADGKKSVASESISNLMAGKIMKT